MNHDKRDFQLMEQNLLKVQLRSDDRLNAAKTEFEQLIRNNLQQSIMKSNSVNDRVNAQQKDI